MRSLLADANSAEGSYAPATVMVVFIPLPCVWSTPCRWHHVEPRPGSYGDLWPWACASWPRLLWGAV